MRIVKINTDTRNFFYHYVKFTEPFHNLGKTEKKVLAELMYYRYMLSQEVSTDRLINKLLFDVETKTKICTRLDIPKTRMALILTSLRKDKIIVGRSISKKIIPDIKVGDKDFVLAFKFQIKDNDKGLYEKKGRKSV